MGQEFQFADYRETQNVIHRWLNMVPLTIKVKFNKWLLHLEALPPGEWKRPIVDTLTGHCAGLFEIRAKESHVQYRLLGCHGPGQRVFTLLHGFTKEDKKVSAADCDIALVRRQNVYDSPEKFREAHRYD
jgi:phage-related protein